MPNPAMLGGGLASGALGIGTLAAAPATGGLSLLANPAVWTAIAGGLGALFGGGGGDEMPREQRMLLDSQRRGTDVQTALQQLMLARQQQQDPLWRALQQMAFSRLPVHAKQGMDFSNILNPISSPGLPQGTSRPRGGQPITGTAVRRNYLDEPNRERR